MFVSRIIWKEILYYFSSSFCSGLFKYKVLRYNTVRISNNSEVKASSSVRNNDPRYFTRHQRKFTRDTRPAPFRFSRYFWPLSPPSFFLGTNSSPTWLGSQALFPLSHSVPLSFWTDIFVIICSDFQEALSLLVYRNLRYMDAQVCFLKVWFKTWIDHFFQISAEISRMDVWKHWSLSGLLTFSMLAESLRSFDLSRKIEGDSVCRVIDQILGSYLLSCMAFSVYEVVRVTCLSQSWFIYISPGA